MTRGFRTSFDYTPYPNDVIMGVEQLRDEGSLKYRLNIADRVSKTADIPFINMPQGHLWKNYGWEVRREPTNEELDCMANMAISSGARGLIYFWYGGFGQFNAEQFGRGLTDTNLIPRIENVYGERKWDKFTEISARVRKLGPVVLSFDNSNRKSFSYQIQNQYPSINERDSIIQQTYFNELYTYIANPADNNLPQSTPEAVAQRYLQVAVFNNPDEQYSRYCMITNRRCSPYEQGTEEGGRRYVKVEFDANSSSFSSFNNWKVINTEDNSTAAVFDKTTSSTVDFGWFLPGQGKLYKIAPVMQEGGTLIVDENFEGVSFDCKGVVYSVEKNITIGLSTTINFRDTAKISMQGGTFTCGNYLQPNGPRNVHFRSSYSGWDGLEFDCCDVVNISNAVFENIAPLTKVDSINYAVKLLGCFVYNISNNTFTNLNGFSSGAINSSFYGDVVPENINPYITHNTFDMNSSNRMIVKVQSYACNEVPVIIDGNTFTSSASSSQAIFLSGVTGGAVKNNSINGYNAGINSLETSIDIFQNDISSSLSNSSDIYGCAYSTLKMSTNGPLVMAGYNQLSNTGSGANNLDVENSYFLIDNGYNIFNISLQNQGKHLSGYFPDDAPTDEYATNNCFKDNGSVTTPVHDVTWGAGGQQVNFIFTPYLPNCMPGEQGSDMIVALGNGVYDTIFVRSGSGGGMKGIFINTARSLFDSICVETRKRNYSSVRSKCTNLLNIFPDSIQSLDAISKLYLGTRMTDTSSASFSALKIYYENLILNHPSNIPLVKKCNYMVQKCKVQLRQYTSAMAGFQQIINENPYSYEGLIAKWDYMATHLLDSISGGALSGEGDDPHDKFTKEQRQVIKTSVSTALQNSKLIEEKIIQSLTTLASVGDINAAKQLEKKMALRSIVKVEHPRNITEHIRIVNSDIRAIYGQSHDEKGKIQNVVPKEFRLSQNYPNPFNPTTKIRYDLPKNVKVKLIIYDILGREVIRLVNNEFKQAGRYTVEFNGNNYASGVYFYRLDAGNPSTGSGQGFIQSKKMVLVK